MIKSKIIAKIIIIIIIIVSKSSKVDFTAKISIEILRNCKKFE